MSANFINLLFIPAKVLHTNIRLIANCVYKLGHYYPKLISRNINEFALQASDDKNLTRSRNISNAFPPQDNIPYSSHPKSFQYEPTKSLLII